jgi:hypothetical protein
MADPKKRPVLDTTKYKDTKEERVQKSTYLKKERPVINLTGEKKKRPTAQEQSAKKPPNYISEKLGKGMAYGIDYAMKSVTKARPQKKTK